MRKYLRSTPGKIIFTILLVVLPVIPVWSAAVIPNPTYKLTTISLMQIGLILWMVGVTYHWEWYSIATFLIVLLLIVVVWRGVKRK